MIKCRGMKFSDEDDAHDFFRQREIDEGEKPMTPRNAAGVSIEDLALQDAYAEGALAGARGSSYSLNPNQDGTPEHDAWNRGWQAATSVRAARMVA